MADSSNLNHEIERLSRELESTSTVTAVPESTWWSTTNAMTISTTVLAFGVIVILTIAYLIQRGRDPDQLLKIFGTTLIVVMAVFLVVAGYSDQQISPVIGLMGTIAGYLLGRSSNPAVSEPAASKGSQSKE